MIKNFSREWRIRLSHHPDLVLIKVAAAIAMLLSGNTAWCFLSMFVVFGTATMTSHEIDCILPMTDEELKWKHVTTAVMLVLKYSLLRLLGRGVFVALYYTSSLHHLVEEHYDLNMLIHHPLFMAMFYVLSTLKLLELAIEMALGLQGKKEKGKWEILIKALDVFSGGIMVYCGFSVLFPKYVVIPDYESAGFMVCMAVCSLIALLQIFLVIKKWKPTDVSLEQLEF